MLYNIRLLLCTNVSNLLSRLTDIPFSQWYTNHYFPLSNSFVGYDYWRMWFFIMYKLYLTILRNTTTLVPYGHIPTSQQPIFIYIYLYITWTTMEYNEQRCRLNINYNNNKLRVHRKVFHTLPQSKNYTIVTSLVIFNMYYSIITQIIAPNTSNP